MLQFNTNRLINKKPILKNVKIQYQFFFLSTTLKLKTQTVITVVNFYKQTESNLSEVF